MLQYQQDKKIIVERIENNSFSDEEIKGFLVAHNDLLKKLCNGINKGLSREGFLENIQKYYQALHGNTRTPYGEDVYLCMRQALNNLQLTDNSIIKANRGRGGGLYVAEKKKRQSKSKDKIEADQTTAEQQLEQTDIQEEKAEKEYYPSVQDWAVANGYQNCQITGGKLSGFKWENPDLIDIQYTVGEFTRAIDFGITSFEVKLRVVPEAIWQAAHYRKFSREVYVAYAKPQSEVRGKDDGRVFQLAVELGVGVLALTEDRNGFELIHSPLVFNPSISEIDLVVSRFRELFNDTLIAAGKELKDKLGFKIS